MKNIINEMKNTLEGLKSRLNDSEKRMSEQEDHPSGSRVVELTAEEHKKEKRMKRNEDSLRDFWNNIKHTNIYIIGVSEGEEKEKGPKKLFEAIIAKNLPNLGKEIVTQVLEAQRGPYRINPKRNTTRHIVIKMMKIEDKERRLKAAREKSQVTYKGTPIRLSADFSAETLQARREWSNIFKVMKGKAYNQGILYPARHSFRFNEEIKSFTDKQKLK